MEQQIKQLQVVIDYLKGEQDKNPSQENENKLKEAEDKLRGLKGKSPQSPQSPQSLIIGGIIVLLAISGIGFLVYIKKKKK